MGRCLEIHEVAKVEIKFMNSDLRLDTSTYERQCWRSAVKKKCYSFDRQLDDIPWNGDIHFASVGKNNDGKGIFRFPKWPRTGCQRRRRNTMKKNRDNKEARVNLHAWGNSFHRWEAIRKVLE